MSNSRPYAFLYERFSDISLLPVQDSFSQISTSPTSSPVRHMTAILLWNQPFEKRRARFGLVTIQSIQVWKDLKCDVNRRQFSSHLMIWKFIRDSLPGRLGVHATNISPCSITTQLIQSESLVSRARQPIPTLVRGERLNHAL
jgi:hypothetical protein